MKTKYLIIVSIFILLLWIVTPIVSFWMLGDLTKMSLFGELYGSINALFSGFALAAIIFTVYQQHQELSLQREELKLQREEMRASREELAKQSEAQTLSLEANLVQFKITAKEIEVRAIEMESFKKVEYQRDDYIKKIRGVQKEMEIIIKEFETKLHH
jgi:hypothetical protein